ncbi:uncharacterized protein Dere_GG21522 [Drosophila erecta]|uniref:Protein deadlock n=1 Tax=Drosophila erecta TaxID=7220 RepID=B3NKU3_DROER|nr:uncharacterized protein Dere_GG21522 [Drosophila erecta]
MVTLERTAKVNFHTHVLREKEVLYGWIVENLAKMRMRQKLGCWQQILTLLGTNSMSEQEWNTIFKGFLESWLNPYCIQISCDPSIPIRPEFLVRPRKVLQGNQPGSMAKIPEAVVFPGPTNSTTKSLPREAPSSSKSRDTIVNSTDCESDNGERSPSHSNKSSTYKNPGNSEYAKIWKQGKRHTTASSSKARITKRRDSKLLSMKQRPDTFASVAKGPVPSASAPNGNVFKCREASPHAPDFSTIKTKDSCASPDVLALYLKNSASKPTQRRKSFGPTQDYEASSNKIIKRRNTCIPTDTPQYLKLKTGKGQNSGEKPNYKQQLKTPPPSMRDNVSEESSDECDDQLPLSKLLVKMKSDKPLDLSCKIKLTPKDPSLKTNFTVQSKQSAEMLTIKPKSETTRAKPLRNSAQKRSKQLKQRLKVPPQTTLLQLQDKQSLHEQISQQAENFSKVSGQQNPSTSRVQRNTRQNKMRNSGVKSISAKSLMPAHIPLDYAPNRMHMDQALGDAIKLSGPVGGEEANVDEIDCQLVQSSEFFEKLTRPSTVEVDKSDLIDIFMAGNEELDYEDEDDDVLSMAASWDGLNDEILPELEPIENTKTAEQILQPDPEEVPKMQKINSFRIPKLNAEDLKTQPSVMRSLYEMEELEKNNKESAKPVPLSLVDPPLAESNRKLRDEATAARRAKETLPVFAPPYRIAPESAVALVSANSQVPLPTSAFNEEVSFKEVFGLRCMQSVDNRCISFNCDHTMSSLGEVQRRLLRMDEDNLVNIYRQTIRSFTLFQTYYTSFVDIFEFRHLWQHLLIMLADCRLYKSISAPLLAHAYEALHKCGMQKEAVKCIMEHVWLPCKAHKYRDLMLMTLNILSNANWEDYCDELIKLDKDYNFEIPQKNLITILKSSVDRADKFSNALDLITLHPNSICTNETIMSILNTTSKGYRQNESASASQGTPGAESGPSLIIAPSDDVQPCPPFRRHSTVHNFRHSPIAAHNSNKNNSFHFSNEYANNKNYLD